MKFDEIKNASYWTRIAIEGGEPMTWAEKIAWTVLPIVLMCLSWLSVIAD